MDCSNTGITHIWVQIPALYYSFPSLPSYVTLGRVLPSLGSAAYAGLL